MKEWLIQRINRSEENEKKRNEEAQKQKMWNNVEKVEAKKQNKWTYEISGGTGEVEKKRNKRNEETEQVNMKE